MATERESNNTIATAQNLGAISTTGVTTARSTRIEGRVGSGDPDIFRFLTGNPATCEIKLTLTGTGSNVSLFRDSNGNRQFDAGELIDSTLGKTSKTIVLEGAGSNLDEFHAQVSKGGSAANYTLDITVTPKVARESEPNNIESQAKNIGQLNGVRKFVGSLDVDDDRTDIYRFQLGASRNVSLSLGDPNFFATGKAKLSLHRDANNNNRIDAGEFVASSTGSRFNELISSRQLSAGSYFVSANSLSGNIDNYTLNMSARG